VVNKLLFCQSSASGASFSGQDIHVKLIFYTVNRQGIDYKC